MIEIKDNISATGSDNPMLSKTLEKEEYTEKVVESAVTAKWNPDEVRTAKVFEVSNVYNDEGTFVIEIKSDPIDTLIRVPRDLMKKVIYDIYLK